MPKVQGIVNAEMFAEKANDRAEAIRVFMKFKCCLCNTKISDFKTQPAWFSSPNLVELYQDANDFAGVTAGKIYCYACLFNLFQEAGFEEFWWEEEYIIESTWFESDECDCEDDRDFHECDTFYKAQTKFIEFEFGDWIIDNTVSLVLGHVTPWWRRY